MPGTMLGTCDARMNKTDPVLRELRKRVVRKNCEKCNDRMVQGTTTLRLRQKGSLASVLGFRETLSAPTPPPTVPLLTRQGDSRHLWDILDMSIWSSQSLLDPPLSNRNARVSSSNGLNPLLGPEQMSLYPPTECWACAYMPSSGQVKHNAWGRLWTGLECVVWVIHTQAEESPGSSGWRQEWEEKEKEECLQTIDKGRGPLLPQSHVLEQSSEDSENSNLDLVFQVVLWIYLSW